jgi:hypothetical protein
MIMRPEREVDVFLLSAGANAYSYVHFPIRLHDVELE